jgi:arginyl-tRNA synthetase
LRNNKLRVKCELRRQINEALKKLHLEIPDYDLEFAPEEIGGDFATNVALIAGSRTEKPSTEIAEVISRALRELQPDTIDRIEVVRPGFINIYITRRRWQEELDTILRDGKNYGKANTGRGKKVLIEFVSANPTGPLHVGHGRCAAIGDSLANILTEVGYRIVKEYYVNDMGNQIDLLEESIKIRQKELRGENVSLLEAGYRGAYVREIAEEIESRYGKRKSFDCRVYATKKILSWIRKDLEDFGIKFDNWFFESTLYGKNKLKEIVDSLKSKGLIYEKEGAQWFKSSQFGDEKDRVVIRENKRPTYFTSDIAYHYDKFRRGFKKVIDIWGADHHGYVDRIRASVAALGIPVENLKIILYQLVSLMRGGQQVSMSTREGEFVTLRQVMEEVGKDSARFFLLMRGADSRLDFDLELAKKQSPENPVYYVQYAHARICSIFREKKKREYRKVSLMERTEEEEKKSIEIIKKLYQYPEIVKKCGERYEPHHLTGYLQDLAKCFHHYYDKYRILSVDKKATKFRLKLVRAIQLVISNGLGLLGILAPERM